MTCKHNDVDFIDDDSRGVCTQCGAECDWHWDNSRKACVEDYEFPDPIRIIDEWYEPYSLGE